jgi:hypothetical protein
MKLVKVIFQLCLAPSKLVINVVLQYFFVDLWFYVLLNYYFGVLLFEDFKFIAIIKRLFFEYSQSFLYYFSFGI